MSPEVFPRRYLRNFSLGRLFLGLPVTIKQQFGLDAFSEYVVRISRSGIEYGGYLAVLRTFPF